MQSCVAWLPSTPLGQSSLKSTQRVRACVHVWDEWTYKIPIYLRKGGGASEYRTPNGAGCNVSLFPNWFNQAPVYGPCAGCMSPAVRAPAYVPHSGRGYFGHVCGAGCEAEQPSESSQSLDDTLPPTA